MNSDPTITRPQSTDAPREDWLRAGVLAGFLGNVRHDDRAPCRLLAGQHHWECGRRCPTAVVLGARQQPGCRAHRRWRRAGDRGEPGDGAPARAGLCAVRGAATAWPELVAGHAVRAHPLAAVACRLPAADGWRPVRDGYRRRSPADPRQPDLAPGLRRGPGDQLRGSEPRTGSTTPTSIASTRRLPSGVRPSVWWRGWFPAWSSGGSLRRRSMISWAGRRRRSASPSSAR